MTLRPWCFGLVLGLGWACGPLTPIEGATDSTGTTDSTSSAGTTAPTTGGAVCPDPHSSLIDGKCYCDTGYAFCTDDPADLSCCPIDDPTSATGTTSGSTSSGVTDGTASSTTDSTTDGTTGGMSCPEEQQPPPTCDLGEGTYFCTHPESCGPQGSQVYECVFGQWQLSDTLGDGNCQFDGYDFAYGCVDTGDTVEFLCGIGPGTDCDEGAPSLCEQDALYWCLWGKRTVTNCFEQCTQIGDENMVLYDHGYCDFDPRGGSACFCCDMGDPDCPV